MDKNDVNERGMVAAETSEWNILLPVDIYFGVVATVVHVDIFVLRLVMTIDGEVIFPKIKYMFWLKLQYKLSQLVSNTKSK